jgi:hypothetical protein
MITGKIEYVWKFQTDEDREEWSKVCDSDWGEGYSSVMLGPSASGKFYRLHLFFLSPYSKIARLSFFSVSKLAGRSTLFSGEIATRLPPDGRIAYAGYANMKSNLKLMSFARTKVME